MQESWKTEKQYKDFWNNVKLSEKQHRKCKVVVNIRRMTERSDDTRGPKRQTPLTAH